MDVYQFTLLVFFGAVSAGLIGSLTGLGGGVIIIPLLTVLLGVDLHYAIGTALVSVIATSSGSAAAYVREGITNIRMGMFLEIATTIGAVLGTVIAAFAPANLVAILFGFVLIFNGLNSLRKKAEHVQITSSKAATWLKLPSSYPTKEGPVAYGIKNVGGGFSMMSVAGILSGLLGIGSGAFKVIAMDNIMKVPFKVSTTTSNFMMGVTATASAFVYLQRGYIEPGLCMPVVIGVLIGAMLGAKILVKSNPKKLRLFFSVVILLLAINMIYNGFNHKF
ncbi:sulfite exporter TauE/SafE family protein [Rhizosphaericola mali]|uniref:Probable membrane transporter protein n=1 Tax=Rhizosphaericola mali TaxID=2545455 RepID=A0A5P2G781_9BACT|nr:sulfite exporter TauE/SafE family protein [Rhizosphaericola mali]QES89802.1 sulfite exporter TauE/SafE family protein [Rhizosphaericola mali]